MDSTRGSIQMSVPRTSYFRHKCFSPIVWPKVLKKCSTNVIPLKMPMSCPGSHEGKENVSLLMWELPALLCKIYTTFTMDTSDCSQLWRKTWHGSHWQQRTSSPSNTLNLDQLSWENSIVLNVRLCKMQIEEKNNCSLSEWRGRDPPSWHSFLFLLVGFCLCSERCVRSRGELILQHFLCQSCLAGTHQGDPV